MKTVLIVVAAILGLVLLAAIPGVGLILPVERSQSDAGNPIVVVENLNPTPEGSEVEFTLQTITENGKLLFVGVGGDIDGVINPDLIVRQGDVVRITLINGDGMVHDLFLPDFNVSVEYIRRLGDQSEVVFETGDTPLGSYVYYCTLPGHHKAGQEGKLIVTGQ